jgi:hypothetical protein
LSIDDVVAKAGFKLDR